ncbi:ankyrin [Periconia macrospinosa]|uniref:Ankyrin n=1 Tax=Periconia macrospinosa TaxID=97972 RepID=A0A2V1E9G4_9PLEO|nr:ankyrin [Periconia macrospinosa]
MSKRALENREWENHRAEIVRLYEVKSLAEVMTAMRASAGFVRTKCQYERRLKAWRINKYSKSDDWKFIASRYHARQLEGRQTAVEIRGEMIADRKVRKEIARQGYETTLERLTYHPRLPTPPGIRLYPPPRSPVAVENGLEKVSDTSRSLPQPTPMAWTESLLLDLAEATPWHQFAVTIRPMSIGSDNLLTFPDNRIDDHPILTSTLNTDNGDLINATKRSKIREWYDDILCSQYITSELSNVWIHPACIHPTNYLPLSRNAASQIDTKTVLELTTRCSPVEFLKHAMYLISNNFDNYNNNLGSAIFELLRVYQNRSFLQHLIDQKLVSAAGFLEKLVFPAIKDSNISLLKMIIDSGWSIQGKTLGPGNLSGKTALQLSIEMDREDVVEFLLNQGANGNESRIPKQTQLLQNHHHWFHSSNYENFLELAASSGRFTLVRKLLIPRPQFTHGNPQITIVVLQFAILYGDLESFRFLLARAQELHPQVQAEPWMLLEAASVQRSHAMFSEVLELFSTTTHGLNPAGMGGVLAAAYMSQDLDRVKILHDIGASLTTVPGIFTDNTHDCRNYDIGYVLNFELQIESPPFCFLPMSILHLATERDDIDTVAFLIYNGADVNQSCRYLSPLQIAVYRRNKIIVQVLLEAGADVDMAVGDIDHHPREYCDLELIVGRPTVRLALESGSDVILETLLQYGPNIARFTDYDLLHWAIQGKNSKLVNRVIQNFKTTANVSSDILADCVINLGCHIGFQIISEITDLDPAVFYSVEVMYAIIFHHDSSCLQGFLKEARTILGDLPSIYAASGMAFACTMGYFDLLNIFLDAGARPYETPARQFHIRCALVELVYARKTSALDVLSTLINACDRPEREDDELIWKTALFEISNSLLQASFEGRRHDLAAYLVSLGAELNAPAIVILGTTFHTALQYSAQFPNESLLELLLYKGATPFASPAISHGATATQFAAISGNFKNLSILLKHGVDINEPPGDHEGRTAIEGAAEHGRLDMVRFLLEAGANVKSKTSYNYRRTIYRAWENGHGTICQMIQNWKAQRYGLDECESLETIVRTITEDELDFESPAAKIRYLEWRYQQSQN